MADGGRFKGNREPGCDYFDDIMCDNSVPDIFDTPQGGFAEYERVRAEKTRAGIRVEMNCRPPGCGRRTEVNLSWPELFIIAHVPQTGYLPQGWARSENNQAAYPMLQHTCGQPVAPMIPPEWAARQVDEALRSGLISSAELAADTQVRQLQHMMQSGQTPAAQAQGQQAMYGPPQNYPPGPPGYPRYR